MDFLQPTTWHEALALRAERPDALPIAGGTDVMVELNFDRRRPGALLDLGRVAELREWSTDGGRGQRLGRRRPVRAGHRRARRRGCPAWRWPRAPSARRRSGCAARSAATSAPPRPPATRTRRCWPPAPSSRWPRRPAAAGAIPAAEFYTGVKRNALEPDELIAAVLVPAATGPQQFCQGRHPQRHGHRRLRVRRRAAPRPPRRRHRHRLGRADPAPGARGRGVPRRRAGRRRAVGVPRRAAGVAGAARSASASPRRPHPIDDVRGTAAYRRHALSVMARRAATWAWDEYRTGGRR